MQNVMKSKLNLQKGKNIAKSSAGLILRYVLLCSVGFVYLYPMLSMILTSFMSRADLSDPTVSWLPTAFYLGNYKEALTALDFFKSFGRTVIVALGPATIQTAIAAIVGFGFARFEFPLKKLWFILVVLTFIIPVEVTYIPRYILYDMYHMIDTYLPAYLPTILGQGIKSALFILVFQQFFQSYPISFDEAAELDGANKLGIFTKIAIPMGIPAIVLTFLFSFIWYWNETASFTNFFGSKLPTLPMQLYIFTERYQDMFNAEGAQSGVVAGPTNGTVMAGTMLSVLPVLILFIIFQRQFIESVERSGITGE